MGLLSIGYYEYVEFPPLSSCVARCTVVCMCVCCYWYIRTYVHICILLRVFVVARCTSVCVYVSVVAITGVS